MKPRSETEIAEKMIEHLTQNEWDVYQEVCLGRSNRAVDILAIRGRVSMAVEAKTSLSLAVIEQAYEWRHYANHCCIVTPKSPGAFQRRVLEWCGVGAYWVHAGGEISGPHPRPVLSRRTLPDLIASIKPEHKHWCAAGSQHGRYTAFGDTKRKLIDYVARHNGCLIKDAVESIKHHYSCDKTAIGTLVSWAGTKVMPEICVRKEGGKNRFFVSTETVVQ